MRCIKGMPRC